MTILERELRSLDFELENLKRFIADGGKCWGCGDTGVGNPTLQEPGGSACDCGETDNAMYQIAHWDERKQMIIETYSNLPEDTDEKLDF